MRTETVFARILTVCAEEFRKENEQILSDLTAAFCNHNVTARVYIYIIISSIYTPVTGSKTEGQELNRKKQASDEYVIISEISDKF